MAAYVSPQMKKALKLCTHPDPKLRISAYAAAKQCGVSQSAISQNRDYRTWKDNQKQGENQQ